MDSQDATRLLAFRDLLDDPKPVEELRRHAANHGEDAARPKPAAYAAAMAAPLMVGALVPGLIGAAAMAALLVASISVLAVLRVSGHAALGIATLVLLSLGASILVLAANAAWQRAPAGDRMARDLAAADVALRAAEEEHARIHAHRRGREAARKVSG